jgi:hypothetical protein
MKNLINSSIDLETTENDKKSGFMEIASRKAQEAVYYVGLGDALEVNALKFNDPYDLIKESALRVALCDAAGVSTKARSYLDKDDIEIVLKKFTQSYLLQHGHNYQKNLVSRYLLTQGDALGGRMRNIVGKMALEKLTRSLFDELMLKNINFEIYILSKKTWIVGDAQCYNDANQVKAIKWEYKGQKRLLYYDLTVPIVKKNIDLVLFNNSAVNNTNISDFRKFIGNYSNYLALGELKGGIDPAGADEHWKTANTALQRIRKAFKLKNHSIDTFFIGAAIEKAMATEIFEQWKAGDLSVCANLTKNHQVRELCSWIITH